MPHAPMHCRHVAIESLAYEVTPVRVASALATRRAMALGAATMSIRW